MAAAPVLPTADAQNHARPDLFKRPFSSLLLEPCNRVAVCHHHERSGSVRQCAGDSAHSRADIRAQVQAQHTATLLRQGFAVAQCLGPGQQVETQPVLAPGWAIRSASPPSAGGRDRRPASPLWSCAGGMQKSRSVAEGGRQASERAELRPQRLQGLGRVASSTGTQAWSAIVIPCRALTQKVRQRLRQAIAARLCQRRVTPASQTALPAPDRARPSNRGPRSSVVFACLALSTSGWSKGVNAHAPAGHSHGELPQEELRAQVILVRERHAQHLAGRPASSASTRCVVAVGRPSSFSCTKRRSAPIRLRRGQGTRARPAGCPFPPCLCSPL